MRLGVKKLPTENCIQINAFRTQYKAKQIELNVALSCMKIKIESYSYDNVQYSFLHFIFVL